MSILSKVWREYYFDVDLRQLWMVLPRQLPGVVSRKWGDGHIGRIESLIPAFYPDGQAFEAVFCQELENFKIGDQVVFSWRPAGDVQKEDQPDGIEAVNVEHASPEAISTLTDDYYEVFASELQRQINRHLEEQLESWWGLYAEAEKRQALLPDNPLLEFQGLDDSIGFLEIKQEELAETVRSLVSELLDETTARVERSRRVTRSQRQADERLARRLARAEKYPNLPYL